MCAAANAADFEKTGASTMPLRMLRAAEGRGAEVVESVHVTTPTATTSVARYLKSGRMRASTCVRCRLPSTPQITDLRNLLGAYATYENSLRARPLSAAKLSPYTVPTSASRLIICF